MHKYLLGSLAPLLLFFSGCAPDAPLPGEKLSGDDRNLVIILVDTLRPDRLGCYGYERARTPVIDQLAAEGLLFENAYSGSSFTGEAVASLFMGRPPAMNPEGLGWSARPLPQVESLPKRLEAAGYKTGIFSTSFVMRFRGFYDSFQEAVLFPGETITTQLEESLTDEALDFARKNRDGKTFQYLHYYAPHAPYNPPAEILESLAVDRDILDPAKERHPAAMVAQGMKYHDSRLVELQKHYDGEIAFIDHTIGRYIDGLRELGTLSNTVIVLVSDHGEEFMEHGFADHAWTLYDEVLRIPLIIWAPGLIAPGTVSEKVSSYDIAPTLLQVLEIAHQPFDDPVAGQYLLAAGQERWHYTPRTGPLFASLFPESRAQLHAVLFDGYKYIAGPRWLASEECKQFWLLQGAMTERARENSFRPLDPWAPAEVEALFNLQEDTGEQKNLLDTAPDRAAEGRQLLDAYRESSKTYRRDAAPTTMEEPFDEAFIDTALEALSDEADDPEEEGNDSRLSPEVVDALETMGYL